MQTGAKYIESSRLGSGSFKPSSAEVQRQTTLDPVSAMS